MCHCMSYHVYTVHAIYGSTRAHAETFKSIRYGLLFWFFFASTSTGTLQWCTNDIKGVTQPRWDVLYVLDGIGLFLRQRSCQQLGLKHRGAWDVYRLSITNAVTKIIATRTQVVGK